MFYAIIIAHMQRLYFVWLLLVLLYYYYQEVAHLILAFGFLLTFMRVHSVILVKIRN